MINIVASHIPYESYHTDQSDYNLSEHSSNAAMATKEDGVFRKAYRDDAIIAICRPEK